MADLLGSVKADYRGGGSWVFSFGRHDSPNYITKRFTVEEYGSSAKAKAAAEAYQKEIQPKIVSVAKTSQYDSIYKNNKSFRNLVGLSYEDFLKKSGVDKRNFHTRWIIDKKNKKLEKPGYNTSTTELAKKLGVSENVLTSYSGKSVSKYENASKDFIKKNFPYITRSKKGSTTGGLTNFYKDPTENVLKKWEDLQKSTMINKESVKGISEIDDVFRNDIVVKKLLPDITEVISKTSLNTPSKAAYAMALYSRALRGEPFRKKLGVKVNENAGKRLITQLGEDNFRNSYRTQFYNLALDNVNKLYKQNGTLKSFRTAFSKELRKALQLKGTEKIPYNINEVISLSAGETRGVQPFSVFVDATSAKVNSGALAGYQGQLSKRLQEVQDFLAEGKTSKAQEAAGKLIETQKATTANLLEQGFTKSQIKQLNLPEIKVGKKIDPKIYSPEQLARWKEAGLDIPQFVKEKGFYIDVKKAKPFWESNVRNTIVEAAKNNVGNICNIFKGKIAYSADGGRIGFQGGCGKEMSAAMEADAPGTLNEVSKTKGILPKFQNAATKFLQSPLLKKGGKFGAIAAGGAAAAGLVKTFMNDDPTTYLSNEDQQKNMLIDMVTGPMVDKPEDRPAILDWQLPVLGAETAAGAAIGAKPTLAAAKGALGAKPVGAVRTAGRILGKGLMATGTPLGLAALEPLHIAGQVQQGDSLGEMATNPWNYAGLAFADQMSKAATRGVGANAAKIMRLGISPAALRLGSRFLGVPGLALSLGISGYETYDDWKNKRGWFSEE